MYKTAKKIIDKGNDRGKFSLIRTDGQKGGGVTEQENEMKKWKI